MLQRSAVQTRHIRLSGDGTQAEACGWRSRRLDRETLSHYCSSGWVVLVNSRTSARYMIQLVAWRLLGGTSQPMTTDTYCTSLTSAYPVESKWTYPSFRCIQACVLYHQQGPQMWRTGYSIGVCFGLECAAVQTLGTLLCLPNSSVGASRMFKANSYSAAYHNHHHCFESRRKRCHDCWWASPWACWSRSTRHQCKYWNLLRILCLAWHPSFCKSLCAHHAWA